MIAPISPRYSYMGRIPFLLYDGEEAGVFEPISLARPSENSVVVVDVNAVLHTTRASCPAGHAISITLRLEEYQPARYLHGSMNL